MPIHIGRADCNECGAKGGRCLVIDDMGIWSYCRNCGFREWEWSWGDSEDYLKYLAEQYGLTFEELKDILYEVFGAYFI